MRERGRQTERQRKTDRQKAWEGGTKSKDKPVTK